LFRRAKADPLLKENTDRSRESCAATEEGFLLPDGRRFVFAAAYSVAQQQRGYAALKWIAATNALVAIDQLVISLPFM
jgi:hypothetical protein